MGLYSHTVHVIDIAYKYAKKKAKEEQTTITDYVSRLILKAMDEEMGE